MSKRPGPEDSGDAERLPWLEPYREPAARLAAARPIRPRPAPKPRSNAPLWTVAAIALIVAAGGGGYWLGQRDGGEAPSAVAEIKPVESPSLAPPVTPPIAAPPVVESLAENEVAAAPDIAPEPAPVARDEAPKPVVKRRKPPARKAKVRRADTRRTQYERVVAKQGQAARSWPKMPSPGPAGQVIQLGAFSTRARAQVAYGERLARYPVLSGMPQVIVPIITQPRGEVLYVLRLGTRSRDQSNVVCGNLRRSGDHCLVIG